MSDYQDAVERENERQMTTRKNILEESMNLINVKDEYFMKKDNPNSIRIKLENEFNVIENISLKSSIPIGSIALNYCLIQANIDGVLIGVDSLQQLKENIAFAEDKIPNQYLDEINTIRIENIELLNPSMWK